MVPAYGDQPSTASIVCDRQDCIPLTKILGKGDIILMLTPVVVPLPGSESSSSDPFEPLGRAIAARHDVVHHAPYTKKHGITPDLVEHIKKARVVLFVISGMPVPGEPSQLEYAEVSRVISEQRPQIVLACCNIQSGNLPSGSFPTIVQIKNYSPQDLQAAAAVLFGDVPPTSAPSLPPVLSSTPKQWKVKKWDTSCMPETYNLWQECLPPKFHLPPQVLVSLLDRPGWSQHYHVRDPEDLDRIVGFCATFITFKAKSSEDLVGSLALILVRPGYRNQGLGWALNGHALRFMRGLRGVTRIQLGSMFPRLLYGIPTDLPGVDWDWFERRGWVVREGTPGKGQEVCDWLLKFDDLPKQSLASSGLTFRWIRFWEMEDALGIVERESLRQNTTSWFDQYYHLKREPEFVERNILVGIEAERIVATALVYTPEDGSPTARDLPWAATLGAHVGGVSCVCIEDGVPGVRNSRDAIMIRLLDACIQKLKERGMEQMLIDAVRGGEEGFQSLGFQKWARYRDIWHDVNDPSQGISWPFDTY